MGRAFDKDGSGDLAYEEFSRIIDTFEVVDMAEDEDVEVEVLDDDEPMTDQKGEKTQADVKMKDAKHEEKNHNQQRNQHPNSPPHAAAAPHPQSKEEKCEKK